MTTFEGGRASVCGKKAVKVILENIDQQTTLSNLLLWSLLTKYFGETVGLFCST